MPYHFRYASVTLLDGEYALIVSSYDNGTRQT